MTGPVERVTLTHLQVPLKEPIRVGGDEVTVKRLYRDGETLRLRPENGEHEDLVLPAEDVKIQGRVVYVVHPPRGRR